MLSGRREFLPRPCHSWAVLQLLTALPCPALSSTSEATHGPMLGLALGYPQGTGQCRCCGCLWSPSCPAPGWGGGMSPGCQALSWWTPVWTPQTQGVLDPIWHPDGGSQSFLENSSPLSSVLLPRESVTKSLLGVHGRKVSGKLRVGRKVICSPFSTQLRICLCLTFRNKWNQRDWDSFKTCTKPQNTELQNQLSWKRPWDHWVQPLTDQNHIN